MTPLARSSTLRMFFSLLTLHTWFSGMFEPRSLHFLVTQEAYPVGLWVVTLFGILGFLTFVDLLINDILPEQYSVPFLLKQRHLIFMAIAILNAAEFFVSLKYVASWGLGLYCLLVCSFVAITAFRDIQLRFTDTIHA